MTDEVNWSDACRRVAEWLGELGAVPKRNFFRDGVDIWPDYTRDDAAAMRLQRRLPGSIEREYVPGVTWTAWRRIECANGKHYVQYAGEVGSGMRAVVPLSVHQDLRKALVLAACELIDMGVEPREVAR